jgi:hypothetical protein
MTFHLSEKSVQMKKLLNDYFFLYDCFVGM